MAHVAPVNNEQLIRLAKYFGGTIVSDRVLKDKKPGFLREARLLEGRGRTLPLRPKNCLATPRRWVKV
jgi:hypothetical protein